MRSLSTNIDLQIDFTGALTVKWSGRANDRRPGATVGPTLERLVGMKRYLRFDFTELEHISSSTLVVVLKFFKQLNEQGIGYDYRYDDRVSWQRMTFSQLDALAMPQSKVLAA
jgi:hypothetical protein